LIARLWRDARVTRIFGGTNEIMKEVVARAI
jgi:alkylation response protein AidB-like acyl-CoA dehydrogenase